MSEDLLDRQLQAFAPQSILTVGEAAATLVSNYCDQRPETELVCAATAPEIAALLSAPAARRYDLGVTAGYLETVDQESGGILIARLRDVLVRRLCVVLSDADPAVPVAWTDADMTAFGLTRLERVKKANVDYRIYGFDIASYKSTPDWLNPRHWAHPERWNKDRW